MSEQIQTPQPPIHEVMPRTQGDIDAEAASEAVSDEQFKKLIDPDLTTTQPGTVERDLARHTQADREIYTDAVDRQEVIGRRLGASAILPVRKYGELLKASDQASLRMLRPGPANNPVGRWVSRNQDLSSLK